MGYQQMRHALSVWGTLLVGGNKTNGTILFGKLGDVNIGRGAANRLDLGIGDSIRVSTTGQLQFGSDVVLSRIAANHLHTPDALTVQGTVGMAARGQANPVNSQGGSALTGDGDMGIAGSQFYYRKGGTIYQLSADSIGTIAV